MKQEKFASYLPSAYTNSIGMAFVLIPAGTFEMGSNEGMDHEQPVHTVEITKPFYLGKHPVTQAEWEAVKEENPSQFEGANRPVDSVSWEDAQAFIGALQEKDGGRRYRMPTEAEWEYACRAGARDASEHEVETVEWCRENAEGETRPVGQKPPNRWGLYDMLCNVWEWVQDRYAGDYYERSPRQDPQGPDSGKVCVLRGGSFDLKRILARSAIRYWGYPSNRFNDIGFRLVLLPTLNAEPSGQSRRKKNKERGPS